MEIDVNWPTGLGRRASPGPQSGCAATGARTKVLRASGRWLLGECRSGCVQLALQMPTHRCQVGAWGRHGVSVLGIRSPLPYVGPYIYGRQEPSVAADST